MEKRARGEGAAVNLINFIRRPKAWGVFKKESSRIHLIFSAHRSGRKACKNWRKRTRGRNVSEGERFLVPWGGMEVRGEGVETKIVLSFPSFVRGGGRRLKNSWNVELRKRKTG